MQHPPFWLLHSIRHFGFYTVSAILAFTQYPPFWLLHSIRHFGFYTVSAILAFVQHPEGNALQVKTCKMLPVLSEYIFGPS
jgi:hypothetical protein